MSRDTHNRATNADADYCRLAGHTDGLDRSSLVGHAARPRSGMGARDHVLSGRAWRCAAGAPDGSGDRTADGKGRSDLGRLLNATFGNAPSSSSASWP